MRVHIYGYKYSVSGNIMENSLQSIIQHIIYIYNAYLNYMYYIIEGKCERYTLPVYDVEMPRLS